MTMMTKDKDKKTPVVSAEVKVQENGTPRVEVWSGISRRHALLEARAHYRGVARCDFANGEPY